MRHKKNFLKIIAIGLVIVFLITAALMLLEVWEKKQGKYSGDGKEDGIVEYQGKEYKLRDDVETLLIIGLDKFSGQEIADSHESGVQADFLMLLVFDNYTEQCTAVNINRDTMTRVDKLSVGGTSIVETYTMQIALSYNYVNDDNDKIRSGNTKSSVEYLLHDIDVNHYLSLTMDAVPAMNDLVGGVEVTVLDDFTGIDDTLIKGEKVTLTGEQALRYIRSRQGLDNPTNIGRIARQKQYLEAFRAKAVTCMETDEQFIIKAIEQIDKYFVYDSSNKKMQTLAKKFEDYEFLGIRDIEGESKVGEEFMEFYPDEDSLWELTLELFYTQNTK